MERTQHKIILTGNAAPARKNYKRLLLKFCLGGVLCAFLAALLFPFFAHARECGHLVPSRFDVLVMELKAKVLQPSAVAYASESKGCH